MNPRPTGTAVNLLATQLDEQVATLHFPAFGAVRTVGTIVLSCKVQLKVLSLAALSWIHCAGAPRQKIQAESSPNGSELRSAGLSPHKIRAELSSNASSRPASDKKSALRAHQMAPAG